MQKEWHISYPAVRFFKDSTSIFFALKICMSFLIGLMAHFMKFYS